MCGNSYKCHSPKQTLRQSGDARCEADIRRREVASLSGQLGTSATWSSGCWSVAGSHRGKCHRNESFRSRKTRPRNSNSDIYTQGSPFHVSGTSKTGRNKLLNEPSLKLNATNLSLRNVAAATTNKFLRVEVFSHLNVTPRLSSVISLKKLRQR